MLEGGRTGLSFFRTCFHNFRASGLSPGESDFATAARQHPSPTDDPAQSDHIIYIYILVSRRGLGVLADVDGHK